MGYAAGETLLLAIIRTATGFTAANTARGDWKPLNNGGAAVYAILTRQPGEVNQLTNTCFEQVHNCGVEVWQRYKDDGTTATNLQAAVDTLIAKIEQYRRLNDTSANVIFESGATGVGEVEEMWNASGGPHFLRQIINVQWREQAANSYLD